MQEIGLGDSSEEKILSRVPPVIRGLDASALQDILEEYEKPPAPQKLVPAVVRLAKANIMVTPEDSYSAYDGALPEETLADVASDLVLLSSVPTSFPDPAGYPQFVDDSEPLDTESMSSW
jgi:hypothetical protein